MRDEQTILIELEILKKRYFFFYEKEIREGLNDIEIGQMKYLDKMIKNRLEELKKIKKDE